MLALNHRDINIPAVFREENHKIKEITLEENYYP